MEQSIIYVQNSEGQPLMPTRRRNTVWYWLRTGQARVISREPFTIRLRFETTSYTQPVSVGVDTGSKVVGIVALTNGEVVVQAEVHLRDDITQKMMQRRRYRRARRSRKTRYRAARWANRRRKAGWLPPSLRSKADATLKAVRFVASLLPVSQVNVEVGSFDTQKMQNPEISGVSYQQGELSGYLVREYVLGSGSTSARTVAQLAFLFSWSILYRSREVDRIGYRISPSRVSPATSEKAHKPPVSLDSPRYRRRLVCRSKTQPTSPR